MARETSGPQGGSSSSSASHPSSLLSAEEAEVRVTGPRGQTDTVDTPMPKDPGRTGHLDASLCTFGSRSRGLSLKLGGVKTSTLRSMA